MKTISRFFSLLRFRYIVAAIILLGLISVFAEDRRGKIAVLNIEGIVLSSGGYTEAVREIERNGSFKALVVRIDSPGGSVAASQEIYSLVKRLSEKMPVVASMGNVAASGGYYIACGAQTIFANPGTLTGSIGVIATFANYKELLSWAKVDFEVIKTGDLKDTGTPLRALTGSEREYLQKVMDDALGQFQEAVSQSRKIDPDTLKNISDGRLLLGLQAKESGLVDETGTLLNAIEAAAQMAEIPANSPVVTFPERKFSLTEFLLSGRAGGLIDRHFPSSVLRGSGIYYLSEKFGGGKIF
ncbi:MAG: signal peptide peptidase SppA [Thermodesulfobacteriota bacterium]